MFYMSLVQYIPIFLRKEVLENYNKQELGRTVLDT